MRTNCLLVFLICSANLAWAAPPSEVIWPGWMGPNRDGWVNGFQPPAKWPEHLEKRWQVEVGTGYGSPLVAGDKVYQHARQGEDEVLWCLDLATGETKWRQSHTVPFKMGGGGESHGKGPKSSPVLADGRIFTMSITGVLTAWDASSGKLLWRRDETERYSNHKRPHPYWGASTSPIVDGNRVIVHFGTDAEGALMALDVATGKEVWTHGKDGPSYSSPLLVEMSGIRQVVEWNHRALVGVESKTGQFLWEYPFPHEGTDQNMPTPTHFRGRILLGGENRGIRCLEPMLSDGKWSVREVWQQDDVALDMSSAVINGEHLYGFSHYGRGRLFCLDPKTGEVTWQGPGRAGNNVMFLSIPKHVVALFNDGQLKVVKASSNQLHEAVAYRVADTPTWAPPVMLSDGVLIKDEQRLTFWSLPETRTNPQ